jgi:hypothetical protein
MERAIETNEIRQLTDAELDAVNGGAWQLAGAVSAGICMFAGASAVLITAACIAAALK